MNGRMHTAFFSPTGSSRKLALAAAEEMGTLMGKDGGQVWDWTFPEGRDAAGVCQAGDVLVFAFPVYAGRVPGLLDRALERLKGNGAQAVVLAVYGNRHYDDALAEAVDVLTLRGFAVTAAAAFVAEHSLTSRVATGRPDAADMSALTDFAREAARQASSGATGPVSVPGNRPYKERPAAADIRPLTRDSCTQCGVCVSVCPMQIISADNPFQVDQGCLRCCACVKSCPEDAKYFDDQRVTGIVARLEEKCLVRRNPEVFFAR